MIPKRILSSQRLRRPPKSGWSWVDRGFLRDHSERLSREAMLLYFFLAAVSDRHGLSFRSEGTIAIALRMRPEAVAQAREELLAADLIACEPPLIQVLSLPVQPRRRPAEPGQGLLQLGDLFRQIARESAAEGETPRSGRRP